MAEEPREKDINKEDTEGFQESPGGDSEAGTTVAEECSDLLSQREEEIKQLQEKVLRLAAEMENTRRRLEREKSEGICYANESIIRDFLPVLDNLERAVEHAEKKADAQSLLEGIRMTIKGFLDTLARYGCTPFESMGKEFDPNYHEAVMQQEVEGEPERRVLHELQKGYTLKDRLLRPSMVVVSKAPSEESKSESSGDSDA